MNTCPENIFEMMNNHLDGELSSAEEQEMKEHLKKCDDCQQHYYELNKTIAFVQSASNIKAPADFVQSTMNRLPKGRQRSGVKRWLRHHPLLAAAALFCLLMSAALFSNFSEDQQFAFTKQQNLVVEGETVVIPEGEVVTGDITIRNGDLRVEGELQGDVTIVNGQYMASTGVITGEVEEIDKAFEWLWYTIKTGLKDAASIFTNKGEQAEK